MIQNETFALDGNILTIMPGVKTIKREKINTQRLQTSVEKIIMPNSVEAVDAFAFSKFKNLKEIVFSENLSTIRTHAFEYTGLKSVIVPDSVAFIGSRAFLGSEISDIKLPQFFKSLILFLKYF